MKKTVFKAIFFSGILLVIISNIFVSWEMYSRFSKQLKNELSQEIVFVAQGVENEGLSYFGNIPTVQNRLTLIEPDGKVIYDNRELPAYMENHAQREEVIQALEHGRGQSTRYSSTTQSNTIYQAIKLENGQILRMAAEEYLVWKFLIDFLKYLGLVLLLILVVSLWSGNKLAKRIVKPINSLQIDEPEKINTYDELAPLVGKIIQQKRILEERVFEAEQKQQEFAAMTDNMSEGFILTDTEGNLLAYNKSAIKLLRAPKEPRTLRELNRDVEFIEVVEEAFNGHGQHKVLEMGDKYYQLLVNPVKVGETVKSAVIIILDITPEHQWNKLRSEFTANVSHELKTPLTGISGRAEMIGAGLVKNEDIPEFANRIYKDAQRLLKLINDIISLSRLDDKEVSEEFVVTDLRDMAHSLAAEMQDYASSKQVEIIVNSIGEDFRVLGVPQILREMIFNLLDNAIKFNYPQGKVFINCEAQAQKLVVEVKDTGMGIHESEQERIWERFYRVDKSHSPIIPGSGIGLSMVKHGARYHNAVVECESNLGKGTSIKLIFPKLSQMPS